MTLRFFRRKSRARRTSPAEPIPEQPPTDLDPPARSSRRRRGGAGGASGAKGSGKAPAPQKEKEAAAAKPPSGRGRRGRRGGAGRKAATKHAEVPAAVPEVAPEAPTRPRREPGTPEALLARQEAALERLVEQQLAVFKGLQGSLSAIENRLAGISRLGAEQPRVGVFVDVPNIMYAAERLRAKIDYAKLLDFLVRGRELVRASAYAPISDDPQTPLETQKFVQPFLGRGYSMVTKPLKRYADGSIKANFDVELAIDVLTMSDRLDIVILVSGDSDFRRLVELVASKGVRVEVVAFGESTAVELRAAADEYVDIGDHLAELRAK